MELELIKKKMDQLIFKPQKPEVVVGFKAQRFDMDGNCLVDGDEIKHIDGKTIEYWRLKLYRITTNVVFDRMEISTRGVVLTAILHEIESGGFLEGIEEHLTFRENAAVYSQGNDEYERFIITEDSELWRKALEAKKYWRYM